jgi:predicted nuclease with TOPRIM domain
MSDESWATQEGKRYAREQAAAQQRIADLERENARLLEMLDRSQQRYDELEAAARHLMTAVDLAAAAKEPKP